MAGPAPIYIDFVARGMPDISRAFRSVHDTIAAGERATTRIVSQGRSQKERDFQRVAREAARWAREEQQAVQRAETNKRRAAEQGARAVARIRERSATMAGQYAAREAREVERAEGLKTRAAERAERERMRIRERSATMAGRYAAAEARAEGRAAARDARASYRGAERFGDRLLGAGSNALGMVRNGATRLAGTMMQLGGGFSVADSLSAAGNLGRSAALLSNSAFIPGKTARPDVERIIGTARAAEIATHIDANELVEGTRAYVAKSSDFTGGMKNMQFFGTLAKATGTNFSDVTKTAGILRVQNKDLDEAAMKQLLLDVVMQGKSGAVEFEDLAKSAGKITRTSGSYAGSQLDNQRKLLGLSQIAYRTSGSVDETATVLSNLSADALKHSDKIAPVLGKDFLNAKGQIAKGPEEFIADIMEKSGGNLQTIQAMGFGARSMKMFQALAPVFNEAEAKFGTGTKEGRAAGRRAILEDMQAVTSAKYDEATLREDFNAVIKQPAEQFEQSMRALKAEVGDKFIPVLIRLMPHLTKFLEGMVKIAEWASNHPFTGLAAAVTLSITGELAKAAIGETIKRLLTAMLTGGAPPGGVGGGGVGALGGAASVVGAGVAGGAMVGAVVGNAMLGYNAGDERAMDLAAKVRAYQAGDRERGISPEAAMAEVNAAQQRLAKTGTFDQVGNIIASPFSTESSKAYDQYKGDQGLLGNKELQALVQALRENTAATQANSRNGGGGGGGGAAPQGAAQTLAARNPRAER